MFAQLVSPGTTLIHPTGCCIHGDRPFICPCYKGLAPLGNCSNGYGPAGQCGAGSVIGPPP